MTEGECFLFHLYTAMEITNEHLDFIDDMHPSFKPKTKLLRLEMEDVADVILHTAANFGWNEVNGRSDLKEFRSNLDRLMEEVHGQS